jgi:ferric-dicitrate binding protein FerR (iron transport regulator)
VLEDVGTAFDVRAYPADTVARIAIVEGRVRLASPFQDATGARDLTAGDVAEVSRDGTTRVRTGNDLSSIVAWRTGTLVFEHAPLRTIADDLTRWYGIPFLVPDHVLAANHITLTVTSETADQVAQTLCGVSGAICSRRADGAFVISRQPRRREPQRAQP